MKLSVFDLDGTLFKNTSSYTFGKWLYQRGKLPLFQMYLLVADYALHKAVGLSIEGLHIRAKRRFLKLFSPNELSRLAHEYTDIYWKESLYLPAYNRLINAISDNHYTLLLSSGPHFLIEPIAKKLEVSSWHATDWDYPTGVKVLDGEGKRELSAFYAEKLELTPSDITAYTDSYLDLPLLQYVGHPIAAQPDRALRKICMTNNWEIL